MLRLIPTRYVSLVALKIAGAEECLCPAQTKFEELEKDLTQSSNYAETLQRQFNEHVELKHVLEKDATFFQEAGEIQADAPGAF